VWKAGQKANESLYAIAHTRALLVRKKNLLGTEFFGKEGAGDFGPVNTGSFQIAMRKIHPSKIGLSEITPTEIYPGDFEAAQIDTPEIAIGEIGFLPGPKLGIEFGNFSLPKQCMHGVVGNFRLHMVIPMMVDWFC
jgi:hypothetical protein